METQGWIFTWIFEKPALIEKKGSGSRQIQIKKGADSRRLIRHEREFVGHVSSVVSAPVVMMSALNPCCTALLSGACLLFGSISFIIVL